MLCWCTKHGLRTPFLSVFFFLFVLLSTCLISKIYVSFGFTTKFHNLNFLKVVFFYKLLMIDNTTYLSGHSPCYNLFLASSNATKHSLFGYFILLDITFHFLLRILLQSTVTLSMFSYKSSVLSLARVKVMLQ